MLDSGECKDTSSGGCILVAVSGPGAHLGIRPGAHGGSGSGICVAALSPEDAQRYCLGLVHSGVIGYGTQ